MSSMAEHHAQLSTRDGTIATLLSCRSILADAAMRLRKIGEPFLAFACERTAGKASDTVDAIEDAEIEPDYIITPEDVPG